MSADLGQDGRIKRLLAMDNGDTGWSTLVTEIMDNGLHSSTTRIGNAALQGSVAAAPIGSVLEFSHSDLPSNFLPCYGQTVSRTVYAALFEEIGTRWGPASADTFRLPNAIGRMIIGGDGTEEDGDADNPVYGGTPTQTVGKDQMPVHTHGMGTLAIERVGDHSHLYSGGTGAGGGVSIRPYNFQDEFNRQDVPATSPSGAVSDHEHLVVGNTDFVGSSAPWGQFMPSATVMVGIRAT